MKWYEECRICKSSSILHRITSIVIVLLLFDSKRVFERLKNFMSQFWLCSRTMFDAASTLPLQSDASNHRYFNNKPSYRHHHYFLHVTCFHYDGWNTKPSTSKCSILKKNWNRRSPPNAGVLKFQLKHCELHRNRSKLVTTTFSNLLASTLFPSLFSFPFPFFVFNEHSLITKFYFSAFSSTQNSNLSFNVS